MGQRVLLLAMGSFIAKTLMAMNDMMDGARFGFIVEFQSVLVFFSIFLSLKNYI